MRLVDALALYKEFIEELKKHPIPEEPGLKKYRETIWLAAASFFIVTLTRAPTVEAEVVRHGYWIAQNKGRTRFKCSECKSRNHSGHDKYCPNCGAKMDKKVDND